MPIWGFLFLLLLPLMASAAEIAGLVTQVRDGDTIWSLKQKLTQVM